MNIFDIGIILLFVSFIVIGFKHGVIKELVSLIGIIVVFLVAFYLKDFLGNILCTFLPFFKFTGSIEGITTVNILVYQIIAFIIIFSILLTIYAAALKVSKLVQTLVNLTIVLIIPSKILGAIVSFIKGYIILFSIFIVLMIPLKNQPLYYESKLINQILYKTPLLSTQTNNFITATTEIYNLGDKVSKKEISSNEGNSQALDIMLKYKIISRETAEKLINSKKLENINNAENILNKY